MLSHPSNAPRRRNQGSIASPSISSEASSSSAARQPPGGTRLPEVISQTGITVVEGFNGVMGLDALGAPAVVIMSNRITEQHVTRIERWARSLANGKVRLLFDG